MIIYKDIITGDEMFSDIYKMKLVDEVLYEVTGRLVRNSSTEEADEGTDEATDVVVGSSVDVVFNHKLCEIYFSDKEGYTAYLNDYMKKISAKLEETAPEQVETFKTNMNKVMKELLGRFKDLQFFTGESMDCDGMVALLEYRDFAGQDVPVLMFFKHGLDVEQVF